MSRPCSPEARPRARRARALAAGVLAAALLAPTLASAKGPLVMGPLYVEPAPAKDAPVAAPPAGPPCAITVLELADTRRSPETLGMIGPWRALGAPADRDAWLRSVVDVGLTARGFKPTFAAPGQAPVAGDVNARIALHTFWVSVMTMNKNGSVVLRMSAGRGEPGQPHDYRGDITNMYWAETQGEFNGLVNKVFAQALDGMATDLRKACAA